jgi:hypothetical protein
MVSHGRKAGARSPKVIRVAKRISKKVQKNSKKENAVAKRLDFAPERVSECAEPEAEPVEPVEQEQPDTDLADIAEPSADETTQDTDEIIAEEQDEEEEAPAKAEVLPEIDAEDEDLKEDEDLEETEEPRELTEDEKIAASKQDLIEFFESSSFALAMQARLLAKKPDHELNYGCVLSTLAAGSSLPRSVLEHITLVWKKDNKWIRAWLANELCDPTESETKEELTDTESGLIEFYSTLPADMKEAATALSEKPDSEFNFGLMCSTLTTGPLPAEVSKSLAMKWKTDQSWVREWLAGKISTA